jgi:carboxymethylenebutenolidase
MCRRQAAFDPRIFASVCFFATDIHSATLGKGKNDDTLIKVRNGELANKGEVVVGDHNPCFGAWLIAL